MSVPLFPRARRAAASPWRRAVAALSALALGAGIATASGVPAALAAESSLTVTAVQTNGRTNPLGIATDAPTLSWRSASTQRDVTQVAYEIRVADGADATSGNVWQTGRVDSAEQINVVYGGPALADQTRYHWQVRIWDDHGNVSPWSVDAWFETGLDVDHVEGDWISAPSTDSELDRWSDYTVDTDFTLDNLVLGVYFRATDASNAYMWQLSTVDGNGDVTFRPHKKVNGGFTLLENKDISSVISVAQLNTGSHHLAITTHGSTITTSLDGTVIDERTDSTFTRGTVGFRETPASLGQEKATIHGVTVTASDGSTLLDESFDASANPFPFGRIANGDLVLDSTSDGVYDVAGSLPIFRDEFTTAPGKTVARARVYAAVRGVYQLSLDGQQVGDEHLAPGWTDYAERIQYQTYDVTSQVANGTHALGAWLAPGWYSGTIASFGTDHYGTTPSFLADLRIDYTDGTHQWVTTDDGWRTTHGPLTSADLIQGETYDATAQHDGWDQPGYDDAAWTAPGVQPSATSLLAAQPDEPVRTTGERPALARTEPTPGTYLYDLGQNMVGVGHVTIAGAAGTTARIRYGEVLNPDGTLYTANLRSAKATDYYTFAATGTATYEPRFTFHGFRYIEITGVTSAPALTDVTGEVWGSDLPVTGDFSTSNAMLDQLQSNITWGQRGNFLSIPTDTPARDERLGWAGDINVFAPTATWNRDSLPFLKKWLLDLETTQTPDGDVQGVAPLGNELGIGSGTGWSDAAITVAYALYEAYGDTSVIRQSWPMMTKFMDFMQTSAGDDLIQDRGGWLDWLNLDDPTSAGVLGTAYYAEDARMLSEMAAAIGEDDESARLSQLSTDIRSAFATAYIADDGTVQGDSQTAYAIAIGMGMVPQADLDAVGAKFADKVARSDYHLTTGFLGTPWLLPALTDVGRTDLSYRLLLNEDYPSWGYEIANGATTVWERWNSIMPDGSFGDVSMNSFNHYAYGAVGNWMYRNIAGIQPVTAGYHESLIAPQPGGGLTQGSGSLDSVYGEISSDWHTTDHGLELDVTVPVNTTSTIRVPAANASAVSEGGTPVVASDEFHGVTAGDGTVSIAVGSGTYHFVVDDRGAQLGDALAALDQYAQDAAGHDDLVADVEVIRGHVLDALEALTSGADPLADLYAATDAAAAASTQVAAADLTDAQRAALEHDGAAVDQALGAAVATRLAITAVIAPVAAHPLPGDTVAGALTVANAGDAQLADLVGSVRDDAGWSLDPSDLAASQLGAGQTRALAFTAEVPDSADSGPVAASFGLRFTVDGHVIHLAGTTPAWVTVASPVTITSTSATVDGGAADIAVVLHNGATTTVSGHVALTLPQGWRSPGSSELTIAPGDTATVHVPVIVPTDVTAGDVTIPVAFARGDATLDASDAVLHLALATPPAAFLDHVDLGEPGSEAAHDVVGSPSSGTSTEAGLTRRYSNAGTPGSWFSFGMDVTPGQPFVLRMIETYNLPATKKYAIEVNGTQVAEREFRHTGGEGTETFQVLVPDDGTLTASGHVTITLRFTTESGYYDPSIADAWTLAAPADQAPLVAGTVDAPGATGSSGWVRGPATVTVHAVDDADAAPSVEADAGDGFAAYDAPVSVTAQGATTVRYRATDSAGQSSATGETVVRLDSVAPQSTLVATPSTDAATLDHASLAFAATDATSGVRAIRYRVDGGAWAVAGDEPVTITGFGDHTVDWFATDVAGNAELMQQQVVAIDDVDALAATAKPRIAGQARVAHVLTASTGTWNTVGIAYGYQWLRGGVPILGAIGPSYTVKSLDVGHTLAVRVTASKSGFEDAASVSPSTVKAVKATSVALVSLAPSSVTTKGHATVTASVRSTAGVPIGSVRLHYGSHTALATLTATSDGKKVWTLPLLPKGRYSVSVEYLGSPSYAADASRTVVLTVR